MKGETRILPSPFVAQWVAIAQYLLKGFLKIVVGGAVASAMIRGDGFHNLADIAQALVIMIGVWLKQREWKGYPFKLKEIESVLTVAIGVLLAMTGLKIGCESGLGVLSQFPAADHAWRARLPFLPHHESVRVEARWFWPLVALMSGSVGLSLATSWYQITVGRKTGETTIVADGKETLADAGVEGLGLVGVILVQLFGWKMAEYLLGLGVTALVLHTAWDIFKPGLDSLLKRSLGVDVEESLRAAAMGVSGVEGVKTLMTFRIGRGTAVCIMNVVTRLEATRHDALRCALLRELAFTLKTVEDVKETDIHLEFDEPETDAHRIAYACRQHASRLRIVADATEVTHLLVCDLVQGDVAKGRIVAYAIEEDLVCFAARKRVEQIFFREADERNCHAFGGTSIRVRISATANPEVEIGIKLFS